MRTVFVLKKKLVYGGEEFLSVYGNKARAVKAFTEKVNDVIRSSLKDADECNFKDRLDYFKSMNDWWSAHTVKTSTVEKWDKKWTGPQVTLSAMRVEFEDEPQPEYFNHYGQHFMQRMVEFDVAEQGEWDDASTVMLIEVVLE